MKTRHILIATATAVLLASALPPFQITVRNQVVSLGYSFLFSPPHYNGVSRLAGSVDVGTLLAEYVGILAIGAIAWLLAPSLLPRLPPTTTLGNLAANPKWQRIKAGAGTVLIILVALVTASFVKGVSRSYFHPLPKSAALDSAAGDASGHLVDLDAPAKPSDAGGNHFDVAAARKAGYSDAEIIAHLAGGKGAAAPATSVQREAEVEKAHPGWRNIIVTREFSVWLAAQPKGVQALASSERPADAIRLLDKFSAETNPTKQ